MILCYITLANSSVANCNVFLTYLLRACLWVRHSNHREIPISVSIGINGHLPCNA